MKTWLAHLTEKLRAAAWTRPALLVVLSIVLSQYTLWLDERYAGRVFESSDLLRITSPEGVRVLLGTIATSMLTITGVSFSSIMVTMTLASQQFGPRLLRNFLKDRPSQSTLGMLLGAFVFCLLVMKDVQSGEEAEFVPHLSTLTAMVLAIIGLGYFIHFIQHILNEIQAEHVVSDAYRGLEATIETVFPPEEEDHEDEPADEPGQSQAGTPLPAGSTGYVQAINFDELVRVAQQENLFLEVRCRAGKFVSDEQEILQASCPREDFQLGESLRKSLQEAFFIGSRRTPEQDFEYGFRQLVEVALRALSPGINDPFTAMDCIDYLGAGLQRAFSRPLPPARFRDKEGVLRVRCRQTTQAGLVEAALNQIRQAARGRCDVSCQLLEVLARTARTSRTRSQQEALLQQATLIKDDTLPELCNDFDRDAISRRFDQVTGACHLVSPGNP